MIINILFCLVLAAPVPASVILPRTAELVCQDVAFDLTASAMNRDLTGLNLSDPNLLSIITADNFTRIPVNGTQTIAGQYCSPLVQNTNSGKLQLLSHGITSNKAFWRALGGSFGYAPYEPDLYSWVKQAALAGYPTLAIDRLGAGASSHPDPILVVQGPYEYALYHALVQQIKSGSTGQLPCAYEEVIYVGHSYGSEIGTSMAQLYPNDFCQIILTGFSKLVQPSLPGVTLQLPIPAALENPTKYGDLPAGYLTASSEIGHTNSFFGTTPGLDYDPEIADLFFTREDVVSVGQFVTVYLGNTPSPAYTGRVLVLTGEEDQAFCGPGSPVLGVAHCGALLPDTETLFPNADYNWHAVSNTGHVVNLHFTALSSFGVANEFLAGAVFAG